MQARCNLADTCKEGFGSKRSVLPVTVMNLTCILFQSNETCFSVYTSAGYRGKKSGEEARKEQAPESQKFQHRKRISCKEQTVTQLR
jgi:hypothetical protein